MNQSEALPSPPLFTQRCCPPIPLSASPKPVPPTNYLQDLICGQQRRLANNARIAAVGSKNWPAAARSPSKTGAAGDRRVTPVRRGPVWAVSSDGATRTGLPVPQPPLSLSRPPRVPGAILRRRSYGPGNGVTQGLRLSGMRSDREKAGEGGYSPREVHPPRQFLIATKLGRSDYAEPSSVRG